MMHDHEVVEAAGKAGHQFSTLVLVQPTWCDMCDDFVWGLNQCTQCKGARVCYCCSNLHSVCKYTCHKACVAGVTLCCDPHRALAPPPDQDPDRLSSPSPPLDKARALFPAHFPPIFPPRPCLNAQDLEAAPGPQGLLTFLAVAEIHKRVEAYNACSLGLPMELLV